MQNQKEIHVVISGHGKMGQEIEKTLQQHAQYKLVQIVDSTNELTAALSAHPVDIVIDFSTPDSAYPNAKTIIEHRVHPVIGTTGFDPKDIEILQKAAAEHKLGGIIAPNFCLGAVLMMQFAALAARHLNEVEIVEKHHETKLDAPSGTAIKTALMIAENRQTPPKVKEGKESIHGARGGLYHDVAIHAVRLPGYVSSQDVIFGSLGETLTISHNTTSREAYMTGVLLACQKVLHLQELVYGLEHLL